MSSRNKSADAVSAPKARGKRLVRRSASSNSRSSSVQSATNLSSLSSPSSTAAVPSKPLASVHNKKQKSKKQHDEQKELPLPPDSALESGLPPPLVTALVLVVAACFVYSVVVVVSAIAGGSNSDDCKNLTPAPGVHPTPYAFLFVSTCVGVLVSIVVNSVKYRFCGSYKVIDPSRAAAPQQQSGRAHHTDDDDDDDEEEQEDYEEEEEIEHDEEQQSSSRRRVAPQSASAFSEQEMNSVVPSASAEVEAEDDDDDAALEARLLGHSPQRGGNSSSRSSKVTKISHHHHHYPDEGNGAGVGVFDFVCGLFRADQLPFLKAIQLPALAELGWIIQQYGSVDPRQNIFAVVFAIVTFFVLIAEQISASTGEGWTNYSSIYLRWISSGTLLALLVSVAQIGVGVVCFEICGTPKDLGERSFERRKLADLAQQNPATLDNLLMSPSEGKENNNQQQQQQQQQQRLLPSHLIAAERGKIQDQRNLQQTIAAICFPLSVVLPSFDIDILGAVHLAVLGTLVYPVVCTHVVPAAVVFAPMALVFIISPLVCIYVARREFAPFAALVERHGAADRLCQRHRRGAIAHVIVTRIVMLFALASFFQTMSSYAAMFFVAGGGSWAGSVSSEWRNRDASCFLGAAATSVGYKFIIAGLFIV